MRRIEIALSIFLVFLFGISAAQIPDTVWTRSYGGPEGVGAHDIDRTFDGAYIVTGENEPSYANKYAYLLKINSNGDTVWTAEFGDINTDDYGPAPRQYPVHVNHCLGRSGSDYSGQCPSRKDERILNGPGGDKNGPCFKSGGNILDGST